MYFPRPFLLFLRVHSLLSNSFLIWMFELVLNAGGGGGGRREYKIALLKGHSPLT